MSDSIMQEIITKEDVAACVREHLTKADAAQTCGVSVKQFNKRLQKLGMIYPTTCTRTNRRTHADADAVIDHIITNGGTVASAVRQLKVTTTVTTIRKHIKDRGIDLAPYRHAYKRFGSWQVLPDQMALVDTDQLFCECRSCGIRKHVSKHNLSLNRSQGCMRCAAKKRVPSAVVSLDNALTFESVAAFIRHFGLNEKYQMIRLKLKRGDLISIDDQSFKLQTIRH